MTDRNYRVYAAKSTVELDVLAGKDKYTLLKNTIREFKALDSNNHPTLGDIGRLLVKENGFVAIGYKVSQSAQQPEASE